MTEKVSNYCCFCYVNLGTAEKGVRVDGKLYHNHHTPEARKKAAERKRPSLTEDLRTAAATQ